MVLQAKNLYNFPLDPAAAMIPSVLKDQQMNAASAAVTIAESKSTSTFVLLDSQLIANTAAGAGGGVFATSTDGVFLLCSSTGESILCSYTSNTSC